MKRLISASLKRFIAVYDDTIVSATGNDTVVSGNGDLPPPVVTPPVPLVDDDKPTLSQKRVNAILAEEKRKAQQKTQEMVQQLEDLRKSKSLTDQERGNLAAKIEELSNSLLTKEQLAQKERERLQQEHQNKLKGTETERDIWRDRFTQSVIQRDIQDAAITTEAYSPAQIVRLLAGDTRLVEDVDADGKATGKFISKIKMEDKDAEGKPVTLDLTVHEALKRMKERADDYGNLFKSGATAGVGGSGNRGAGGGREVDPATLSPEDYRKWRNQQGLGRTNRGAPPKKTP